MPNGIVKFFNVAKGFGFITADEGGKELFVPAASLVSAGISGLKTGQRVSFEVEPDGKGPKAVQITLLAPRQPPRPAEKPPNAASRAEEKGGMIFYHDPANDDSCDALDSLRDAGHAPHVVEYLTAPPAVEELKNVARLLRKNDQSLVRKYDPLFFELCLDDRFISENEFWGAIVEHPSLIHGPVAATETVASLCRSEKDVETFLAAISPGWVAPAPKPKLLPEALRRLITGEAAPPAKENPAENTQNKPVRKAVEAAPVVKAIAVEPPPKPEPKSKLKSESKPEPKKNSKPKTKPKPAAAAKSKNKVVPMAKPAKPAAGKPAKKIRRA